MSQLALPLAAEGALFELKFDPAASHMVYLDVSHPFVVFNDDQSLPFDPIQPDDLAPIHIHEPGRFADMVWSSDCSWYFVILPDSIVLLHLDGTGWLCRRRSAEFIKMFVEAPKAPRRSRKAA